MTKFAKLKVMQEKENITNKYVHHIVARAIWYVIMYIVIILDQVTKTRLAIYTKFFKKKKWK